MLRQARQAIIQTLWENYRKTSPQIQFIETGLQKKTSPPFALDHFAIVDLPGPHSGIPVLQQMFAALGYETKGQDYLADKQNDFLWMAEENSLNQAANITLPQVVLGDFRLHEMPTDIRDIIEKYAAHIPPCPLADIKQLSAQIRAGDVFAITPLQTIFENYFTGCAWPLPSIQEFSSVRQFNELLAWVLVSGRKPNHFTYSIHLLDAFSHLHDFLDFIEIELQLPLNHEGGKIKGGKEKGIAQASTQGSPVSITLADGRIDMPNDFVEFVWRYPARETEKPHLWGDFFTGFIATHANHVIESLYADDNQDKISSPTS